MEQVASHHPFLAYFSLIKAELRKEKPWAGQVISNVKQNNLGLGQGECWVIMAALTDLTQSRNKVGFQGWGHKP